ncbi:MFS superfamily transporter precursor [Chimaeribacter californicus]|uniref:MFS superfamily transporter n=2 Tax=Chimaeribacter californicus TaxID=2060067 RepID=A0A2N5ECC2_9GAMM|nr:MFS superfamily transporter precursor [Chimaeribacter californicus]
MGMGRFSLTPQLPLMLQEHGVSLSSAGLLASMNYIGYLAGALYAMRLRKQHAWYLRVGLWITIAATLLSAFTPYFVVQAILRFIAGLGGAWALILITAWTQDRLAAAQAPRLSAAVFSGPGAGIMLTGILALVLTHYHASSAQGWLVYGGVALLIGLCLRRALPDEIHRAQATTPAPFHWSPSLKKLLITYTLAGFGYILPATFLSQLANVMFPHSTLAALFWPLFGLAAIAGVMAVMFLGTRLPTQLRLTLTLVLQALGVASVVALPGTGGLVVGTLLTGGGFLAIMQLAMRMGREIAPSQTAQVVGILTTGYATGQLVGPLVSSASVHLFGSLSPALGVAAAGLLVAAGVTAWNRPVVNAEPVVRCEQPGN